MKEKLMFASLIAFASDFGKPIHRNIAFAAPSDYLDVADLKSVAAGGLIREDVLNEIFDISDIPTPFLDLLQTDSFENPYSEWTESKFNTPSLTNKAVSGRDVVSTDNNAGQDNAARIGNHAQISFKTVQVTTRSGATPGIGRSDEMGYQTARRLQNLRQDVEAIALSGQASVQDDNNATAGQSAGLGAWIKTNLSSGVGGSSPGFQTGTKLVTAQTAGTTRGLTMTFISTQIENVYNLGGMPTIIMSVPGITKRLAQFLFTTVYAAKPTQNVDGTGSGVNQTSQGFIDSFKTDFGFFMQIVPNRLQQNYAANTANCYGIDPRYLRFSTLYGWKVEPLGKVGLSDRKLISVDWMLKCLLERAHFNIADVNPTVAVVA